MMHIKLVPIKFDYYFLFKSLLLSTFDVQDVVKIFLKLLDLKMKTPSVLTKLVLSTTTRQGLPDLFPRLCWCRASVGGVGRVPAWVTC